MSFFSKIKFQQFLAVCLISLTVFFGSVWGIGQGDRVLAEVQIRDTVNIPEQNSLSESEYELAKANRNRIQAEMSQKAEEKAEAKANSESVAEKLSLDEIVPPVVENALDLD